MMVKGSLKPAAAAVLLSVYLFLSCVISLLPATGRARREIRIRLTSFFSKSALRTLGVRVHCKGDVDSLSSRGGLVVSNHLSYLDVLIISSLAPSVFITSRELKDSFLLGALARIGGSLFVERRNPSGIKGEINAIHRVLSEGFTVVLFPEGTTSNGDSVRQFKISLFDAAILSGSDVQPLCLRYTRINGGPVTGSNRDAVFYYGDMTFSGHLPRLLSQDSVDVDVHFLTTIAAGPGESRKELAAQAYAAICAAYTARVPGRFARADA